MRSYQYVGLSEDGRKHLKNLYTEAGVTQVTTTTLKEYADGRTEKSSDTHYETNLQIQEYDHFEPWYDHQEPLFRYINLVTGEITEEFLQAIYHSSGPMAFIALRKGDGDIIEESLWAEHEMQSM